MNSGDVSGPTINNTAPRLRLSACRRDMFIDLRRKNPQLHRSGTIDPCVVSTLTELQQMQNCLLMHVAPIGAAARFRTKLHANGS